MPDLRVKHAVKPKPGSSISYDIVTRYGHDAPHEYNGPFPEMGLIKIEDGLLFVTSTQTYRDTALITQWSLVTGTLKFVGNNIDEDPRCGWSIYEKDEATGETKPNTIMTSAYGVLPPTYNKTSYRLIKITMYLPTGWRGVRLYDSYYTDSGAAIQCMGYNENQELTGSIYYEATVARRSDGEEIHLQGWAYNNYSVGSLPSPFTNLVAVHEGLGSAHVCGEGNIKGSVTMTETPESD